MPSPLPDNVRAFARVPHAEIPRYLAACDVLAFPGRSDDHYAHHSSPLKLYEYLASARPVVASDLPSVREVVRHADTAWLVPPDDPDALRAGIEHVLSMSDRGAEMGARGRASVEDTTWTTRAADLLRAAGVEIGATP